MWEGWQWGLGRGIQDRDAGKSGKQGTAKETPGTVGRTRSEASEARAWDDGVGAVVRLGLGMVYPPLLCKCHWSVEVRGVL